MSFLAPHVLPWLLVVPLWWTFSSWRDRAQARARRELLGMRAAALGPRDRHGALRRLLSTATLALGLVALAQPSWGVAKGSLQPRGVDLVVCLDVSRSMLARDLLPSRLQRAHDEITALAQRVTGDRLALVAFAGEARLMVPLTHDMASFAELVAHADPVSVRRGGTDLGAALTAARHALPTAARDPQAIVLLTDGEDPEQRGLAAAEKCKHAGVPVHCVAVATPLGSKIPIQSGDHETYLRDRAGDEVISTPDVAALQRIAAATGGAFADASRIAHPLLQLYERRILPQATRAFEASAERRPANRYRWPLLLALLLAVAELVLRPGRRR